MAASSNPDNGEGPSARYGRSTTPVQVTGARTGSTSAESRSKPRQDPTARLASPVPSRSISAAARSSSMQWPEHEQELQKTGDYSSLAGPGQSMIASGLQDNPGRLSPRLDTLKRTASPALPSPDKPFTSAYDSDNNRTPGIESSVPSVAPLEDPEVVKRHLVNPEHLMNSRPTSSAKDPGNGSDEFSSLQLQGGDITRQVYRWAQHADNESPPGKPLRSKSFSYSQLPHPVGETMDINNIRVPGGFRRDYIRRNVGSPHPESIRGSGSTPQPVQPHLPTNNFLEFLTMYGHFAGEELQEDDEVLGPHEWFASDTWDETEWREVGEETSLLRPDPAGRRIRKPRGVTGTNTRTGAAMLLLKSFMGTGVLFLPRAFLNGGMLFSSLVLLFVSILSYYCFVLLVSTRLKVDGSFGDMGGILYGKHMRRIILTSIVVSQLGFVAAYTVFTAQNLQAFILAVSKCKSFIDVKFVILLQVIIFLPLSLIRDISKLGFTALIADLFILLGLVYLYYFDARTIADQGGVADIKNFNSSGWTSFIGTAIFTFEGIGLILPIQESMKRPQQFPGVLALIMIIITVIFLSAGAISYAAYGSATKTVVLLNLPQDDKLVNAAQLLYSLAILLSTPLQLFPAIRIMENEMFTRSGKYNPRIKWEKNGFRFFLVMLCALVAWGGARDLDKFVSIVGSFACVPLVYVYPVSPSLLPPIHI